MRIYEINAGDKDDITFLKGDPDIDINLQKENPNLRFKEFIEYHCSDALAAMRKTHLPLYRGFRTAPSSAFQGQTREARRTYTSKKMVEAFNEQCAIMGVKTNRTNSISCTTSAIDASHFGDLYYLFPKNGFNFLWSKIIDDFGAFFNDFGDPDQFDMAYNIDEHENWLPALRYSDKDFPSALQSGHEISINGSYVAIEVERPVFGQENILTLAQYLGIK